jgi:hypothetical protein
MSFFEDASLVYIPAAIKNGKTYSIKPTDGTGDLTFTRASSATRVGPNGYIEKVRTNLLTYSEDFSGAGGWGGIGVTSTANYGIAPDGTNTSSRIVFSGANQILRKTIVLGTNVGIFSLYIKGTAGETILITYGGNTDKTLTLGVGWNRFTTDGNAANLDEVFINTFGGATARTIEVWGGQVELGDVATDYIATTTAAVSVGPVSGTPRLDYLGSDCGRLLLEPQRSNVQVNSERFNASGWNLISAGITSNAATAPDGYNGADKMYATGGNSRHINYGSTSGSGTYTFSVFAKAGEKNWLTLRLDDDSPEVNTWFNLSTGTIGTSQGGNPTITPYGNGWYRCSVTYTAASTKTIYNVIGVANANGVQEWTPSGTDGLYIWGAQVEAGAYATSYIPTLGTAVTRVADAASRTSATALIGQTEGTLFVDFVWGGIPNTLSDSALFSIGLQQYGTSSIAISSYNAALYARVTNGVSVDAGITFGAMTNGTRYKAALAYANNDVVFYVNGVSYGADTSVSIPTLSDTYLQNSFNNAKGINQALLFKTRLSNSDLATLTQL